MRMTKPLPYTENSIERVVNGARKSGVNVGAIMVAPDGTIVVLDALLSRMTFAPGTLFKVIDNNKPTDAEIANWEAA
jgi:hypothetical protein